MVFVYNGTKKLLVRKHNESYRVEESSSVAAEIDAETTERHKNRNVRIPEIFPPKSTE